MPYSKLAVAPRVSLAYITKYAQSIHHPKWYMLKFNIYPGKVYLNTITSVTVLSIYFFFVFTSLKCAPFQQVERKGRLVQVMTSAELLMFKKSNVHFTVLMSTVLTNVDSLFIGFPR